MDEFLRNWGSFFDDIAAMKAECDGLFGRPPTWSQQFGSFWLAFYGTPDATPNDVLSEPLVKPVFVVLGVRLIAHGKPNDGRWRVEDAAMAVPNNTEPNR